MAEISSDSNIEIESIAKNKSYLKLLPFGLSSTCDVVGHNKCMRRVEVYLQHFFCVCCDENRTISYVPKPNLCTSIFE